MPRVRSWGSGAALPRILSRPLLSSSLAVPEQSPAAGSGKPGEGAGSPGRSPCPANGSENQEATRPAPLARRGQWVRAPAAEAGPAGQERSTARGAGTREPTQPGKLRLRPGKLRLRRGTLHLKLKPSGPHDFRRHRGSAPTRRPAPPCAPRPSTRPVPAQLSVPRWLKSLRAVLPGTKL